MSFKDLQDVISKANNPYFVDSLFWCIDVSRKFFLWLDLAASSPTGFDYDGKWNGSIAIPLLLVIARGSLMDACQIRFGALDSEIEEAQQRTTTLIAEIIDILSKRDDAIPLFTRWSTWLMRQLLMHRVKETSDIRSSSFIDEMLIDTIGEKLQGKNIIGESPDDAPTWEAWCYQAVLASHAYNGFIDNLNFKVFLNDWKVNIDEWSGDSGSRLRERASLIITANKEIPGQAAHLLAYPIAISESPVDEWIGLWNTTYPLRELVEFEGANDSSSGAYQARGEAGRLLLLVFCIGLAIMDQHSTQCCESNSKQSRDLARLHKSLALAAREMCEIDDTLNREKWLQAVHHLAIRRFIWEKKSSEIEKNVVIFNDSDKPTFSDYLSSAKNDVIELLDLMSMTLLNETNNHIVQQKLQEASVDLASTIKTIRRLNTMNPRKYPIDESNFQNLVDLGN